MNERIKLLAEQANIEFTYDPTETPMRAFVECWEEDIEKFAELIVRECVYEIKMTMVRDGYDTKHYQQSRKHIEHICKHFGVEE